MVEQWFFVIEFTVFFARFYPHSAGGKGGEAYWSYHMKENFLRQKEMSLKLFLQPICVEGISAEMFS